MFSSNHSAAHPKCGDKIRPGRQVTNYRSINCTFSRLPFRLSLLKVPLVAWRNLEESVTKNEIKFIKGVVGSMFSLLCVYVAPLLVQNNRAMCSINQSEPRFSFFSQ